VRLGLLILLILLFSVAPAQASIYNIRPVDSEGGPVDFYEDDDAIFAVGTSDTLGGTICVVSSGETDPGDGSLSCERDAAWGSPNAYLGVGTVFTPIESPSLKLGRWKLLADGGVKGTAVDSLSDVFTVAPCSECDPSIATLALSSWKASAAAMAPIGQLCDAADVAGQVVGLAGLASSGRDLITKVVGSLPRYAVTAVPIGGSFAFGGLVVAGSVGLPTSAPEAYLAVVKLVSCRAKQMYADIEADPPDPNFLSVAEPLASPLPRMADPTVAALASSMERLRSLLRAELTAFERQLGALEAGDEAAADIQRLATARFGEGVRAEMLRSAVLMDEWADALATDEVGDPAITQEAVDNAAALHERVRTSGFTQDERDAIAAAVPGVDVFEYESEFGSQDVTQAPVGKSLVGAVRAAADVLAGQAPVQEDFALAAEAAGSRDPVAGPTAAMTIAPLISDEIPVVVSMSAAASRAGAARIVSYAWEFGDGDTDTGEFTTHVYDTAASHPVTLTVTASDGKTDTETKIVTAFATPPFTAPFCFDVEPPTERCADFVRTRGDGVLTVSGTGAQTIDVDFKLRNASLTSALGVANVDDLRGTVDGVGPGEAGWQDAVLARAREVYDRNEQPPLKRTLDVTGGEHLVFFLVSQGSVGDAQVNTSPFETEFFAVMFPFARANRFASTQVLAYRHKTDGRLQIAFEDIPGAADDFDDDVYEITGVREPAGALTLLSRADQSSTPAGGENGLLVQVANHSSGPAVIESLGDTLPPGFRYVPGTSTGTYSTDPQISGQTLTWTGRRNVGVGSAAGVHYGIAVGTAAGTFADQPAADVRALPIGREATASITVTAAPDPGSTPTPGPVATVAPTPAGPGPTVAVPSPTPVATPAPLTAAQVLSLPAARRCVSRRRFRIRLKQPAGTTLKSATVTVNGKLVATRRGQRVTAPVNLTGLPRGRFTVRIVVRTADGRSLRFTRRYRTCAPKRRT